MEKEFFGIPIDEAAMGKNDGCKNAPEFLFNLFNISGKLFELEGELEGKHEQIFEQAKIVFEKDEQKTKVFFGGTHDATGFIFKAFAEKNKDAKLLIFDAHADCEDALSVTTHEDFVRMLVEKKIVKPENLMILGLRHVSKIEKEFLKENKIKNFYFDEINASFDTFQKFVEGFVNTGEVYVSFDIDVLDSEKMRATGELPEGGLSVEQARELLDIAILKAKVMDLIEFNPEKVTQEEDKLVFGLFNKYFK